MFFLLFCIDFISVSQFILRVILYRRTYNITAIIFMRHLLFILHYKQVYFFANATLHEVIASLQTHHICDCQSKFSGAFLCVTQHRRGGGPTTPDVTLPVCLSCQGICFSPSGHSIPAFHFTFMLNTT